MGTIWMLNMDVCTGQENCEVDSIPGYDKGDGEFYLEPIQPISVEKVNEGTLFFSIEKKMTYVKISY